MIKKLKNLFKRFKIDGYIVPKNDEYFNEYIDPSNDRLKFISNFSGSAGFAIILKNRNYLFVDGRYTEQAKKESGKNFSIVNIPKELPKNILKNKKKIKIGFDPKLHTEKQVNILFKIKNLNLVAINENLVDLIWHNKPKEKIKPFYSISPKYTGKSISNKILLIKKILLKNKIDYLLVTAPENVAWILNIRGQDSLYSPTINSRLLIDNKGKIDFFVNPKKFNGMINNKVSYFAEQDLEKILNNLSNKKIWLDRSTCSIFYKNLIFGRNVITEKLDPIYFLKSIKNNTEIKNTKKTHLIDGIALTKFLLWIKNNFKKNRITEMSAQEKLENFRKMHSSYRFPSFSTISGSGPNGSIIHYKASVKTNRILKKGELYLVDSGGQYHYGTTDVTRTISFGNISKNVKEIYTRVLKGHIAVSNYKIKNNSTGEEIDRKARKYLKEIKLDYPHGTGHGVGYFSNVHEGPLSLSKNNKLNLKNGMILSNEPGYYKEGSFGIRIENLLYVDKNRFKELTLAPIEKDLILKDILNNFEIKWINSYHRKVQKSLLNFMSSKEKEGLKKACLPI